MPEEKVEEKVEYEPGKKYTVTARSSVQLLSIGKILYHRDTYTGVLDEEQLKEILIHVKVGALALEAVEESVPEVPKEVTEKVKPKVEPAKKEESKKVEVKEGWPKKVTSGTKTEIKADTKTPLANAEVDETKAEVDEGASEEEATPEKDEKD